MTKFLKLYTIMKNLFSKKKKKKKRKFSFFLRTTCDGDATRHDMEWKPVAKERGCVRGRIAIIR